MLRVIGSRYLFPSRLHASPHILTRQYARLVHRWVESIGLESAFYGTHSMRRTKAAQIYRKTGNLRAVQLLLGHTKLKSTVRYLGDWSSDVCSSDLGLAVHAAGFGRRFAVHATEHQRKRKYRSEERRVGKECRSRWSPYH